MLVPSLDGAVTQNVIVAGAYWSKLEHGRCALPGWVKEIHVHIMAIGNDIANDNG
jgi:hypothetical protein